MDTLINELDRVCPDCGCTSITCVSTTVDKWLGHCPHCGFQCWQDLPSAPQLSAKQSRPRVGRHHIPIGHDPKRTPILFRHEKIAANKNLPLRADFPDEASYHRRGSAFNALGVPNVHHLLRARECRPWPRWSGTLAPMVFGLVLLAVVSLEVLRPGAVTGFDLFADSAEPWCGPPTTEMCGTRRDGTRYCYPVTPGTSNPECK